MNNLNDKVAYITGGSKGIGFGIAQTLLLNGMKVAITSRNMQAAKKAAGSLSKDSSKVLAIESDVSSLTSETKAVQSVMDHFGQLDVVVANAGVGHLASIEDLSEEDWRETIDTNLTGVLIV
jgi:3-oxoacyl-[acyl-carrier protein] reductase